MSPGIKYAFGRVGLFVLCAGLALFLMPHDWNPFLRLLIGALVSMSLSFVLLRRWRDEVAEQLARTSARRVEQKAKLRVALAGETDPEPAPTDNPEPRA